MSSYFSVDAAFWTDADVIDNFTPEDKYFYLYLLTSPHCNVSGCFELSVKQASYELGYSKDTVEHLIERFVTFHKMIDYDASTKEILIHKWGKHHWTRSDKYIIALRKKIGEIKSQKFKAYLTELLNKFESRTDKEDMVWIPYEYGMDTTFLSFPFNNTFLNKEEKEDEVKEEKKKRKGVFEEFAGEDMELLEALRDFEKMRNKIKKPMSDRAKTILVKKIGKCFPRDQWIDVIEQSIFHGWDSVWPLKDDEEVAVNGVGKNRGSRHGSSSGVNQTGKRDFSEFKPSLDPDDPSTWN